MNKTQQFIIFQVRLSSLQRYILYTEREAKWKSVVEPNSAQKYRMMNEKYTKRREKNSVHALATQM